MKRNVRTDVPFGVAWAERYALLRGIGKTDAEIRRPQVAIISAWSDINNGHSHLNDLAKDVEKGIIEAGGTPYHLPTIGLCDGLAFYGSQYILPSRDLIANEVETQVEGYQDGCHGPDGQL